MNRYQFEAKLQSNQFNPSHAAVGQLRPKVVATHSAVNQDYHQVKQQTPALNKEELQAA